MNVELSAVELQICWERLELDELPVVIDVPTLGRTEDERRRLVAGALAGLRERHLIGEHRVDPDLADVLVTLARYRWAIEAWLLLDRPVRALAACRGDAGAVAVLDRNRVRLARCSPPSLLEELIRLAELSAGPGRSVTVRGENLDAAAVAGRNMPRLAEELTRRGERYDDGHALAQMCAHHDRLGQFGVLARDQLGRQSSGRRVIGLHATSAGWYTQLRRPGHGSTFVTVTPASPAIVTPQLRDLLNETRQLASK
ncbi:MAG TPA: ESX secretion-associated protein EspG [Pseudonocardiaceae bacterium]